MKVKANKEIKLRMYLSRVGSALIQIGLDKIRIERHTDCAVVVNLPKSIPFKTVWVYPNGTVHYNDHLGMRKRLGNARTISGIKEDILTENQ